MIGVNKAVQRKLTELPKKPGVYLYKDSSGETIYVGKAAVLYNRVRQYFQKSRVYDAKTDALVAEIADVDWITVDSEIDALFLESELVRRYLPRYNILLRDDKSSTYIRIDYASQHPTVTFTHRPLDDDAKYFGPYFNAVAVRKALRYLRKAFPYSTHTGIIPKRACLLVHLGLCPGLEENKTSLADYRANLKKLIHYLKGERTQLLRQIEKEMTTYAKAKQFEEATQARNQLFALKGLSKQIIFSDKEFMDISKDEALSGLAELLGLPKPPRRIEGYDISHMQGTDNVASMVVFVNGLPDKSNYRKFKLRVPGNDDFAHMREAITRRLSPKNCKDWGLPDLFLIDGGKGQVSSALVAMRAAGFDLPMIGLAKRFEEIIVPQPDGEFKVVVLPHSSHIVKLLQRIRDESHRFAVSYHSVLKTKRQTASLLDDIPGIGPVTRKKLLKKFGSVRGLTQASQTEIEAVLGVKKAQQLAGYLQTDRT
jgi:excinuclease ABC subunit C